MVPGNLPIGKPYTICVFNRVWHVHQARSLHQSVSSLFLENVPVANLHSHIDGMTNPDLKLQLSNCICRTYFESRVVRATRAAPLPDYGPQRFAGALICQSVFMHGLYSNFTFGIHICVYKPVTFLPLSCPSSSPLFLPLGHPESSWALLSCTGHHYELIPRSVSNAVVTY